MEEKVKKEIARRADVVASKFKALNNKHIMKMSFQQIKDDIDWIFEPYKTFPPLSKAKLNREEIWKHLEKNL